MKRLIFNSCMNWLSINFTDYFFTYFIATKKPVFICRAGNTLPKRPSPLQLPSSKSYNFNYVLSLWLLMLLLLMFGGHRKWFPFGSVWLIILSLGIWELVDSFSLLFIGVSLLEFILLSLNERCPVDAVFLEYFYTLLVFLLCPAVANLDLIYVLTVSFG
jgi:hypothetical protein